METFRNSLSQSSINVSVMILEILMALPDEVRFLLILSSYVVMFKNINFYFLVWRNNINSNTAK